MSSWLVRKAVATGLPASEEEKSPTSTDAAVSYRTLYQLLTVTVGLVTIINPPPSLAETADAYRQEPGGPTSGLTDRYALAKPGDSGIILISLVLFG